MDWQATLEEILAERRQRFGARPSEDDLIALRAGALPEDDRQRLLEQAAVDPEVARALFDMLRFPEPAGDEDAPSDEAGVGQRWQALRDRLVTEGDLRAAETALPVPASMPTATQPGTPAPSAAGEPVVMPRRSTWLPLAAMFILGLGAAFLVARFRDPGTLGPTAEPRINLPIVELLPIGDDGGAVRGSAEVVAVPADAEGLVLALAVPDLPRAEHREPYTLELDRGDGTTSTLQGLIPGIGGVFVLDLPRGAWTAGRNQLRLRDSQGTLVARFSLEVALQR